MFTNTAVAYMNDVILSCQIDSKIEQATVKELHVQNNCVAFYS